MYYIDTHCHIYAEEFDTDRADVIQRAKLAAVEKLLLPNIDSSSIQALYAVCDAHPDVCYPMMGLHPCSVGANYLQELALVHTQFAERDFIAVGEIGLDFYYDHSPRDVQVEVLRRQIRTAWQLDLPIIVHSRDTNDETVELLSDEYKSVADRGVRGPGIMHCFGGTPEMAEALMKLGFMISFAGNVTFKKAENLREAAKVVPLDKLLVETDCPFLTPEPFRGKRNEPSFVVHTAAFLADFYGVEFETLADRTTQNFLDFFGISFMQ